jgi:DNA-binding GntR family transcriptional regulator
MTAPLEHAASTGRVSRASLTGAAYARLRAMILGGEVLPGASLLEQELTALLGMSRTPIRPALARLEAEGLIAIRPRHGIQVRPVSVAEVRDVYEMLTGLEGMAAYRLAERRLPRAALRPLEAAVLGMEAAVAAGDRAGWSAADDRFHAALLELCGNARLAEAARLHRDQVRRVRRLTLGRRPMPEDSTAQHRALFEAVLCGDPEAARAIHQRHRDGYARVLFALLAEPHVAGW